MIVIYPSEAIPCSVLTHSRSGFRVLGKILNSQFSILNRPPPLDFGLWSMDCPYTIHGNKISSSMPLVNPRALFFELTLYPAR